MFLGCLLASPRCCFGQFDTPEVLRHGAGCHGLRPCRKPTSRSPTRTAASQPDHYARRRRLRLFNVKISQYTVTVERAIFKTIHDQRSGQHRQRVDLTAGRRRFQIGRGLYDVAAALDTDTSEHSQIINSAAMPSFRSMAAVAQDLALLSTNVSKSPQAAVTGPTSTPGVPNVNGRCAIPTIILFWTAWIITRTGPATRAIPPRACSRRRMRSPVQSDYGRL